jgi:hypothetical protein
MDTSPEAHGPDSVAVERELDRELAEVEAAIALVRSGAAAEVSVANLRFGEEVLRQVRGRGADRGVRLDPLQWPEDEGCDLRVRRIDD